MLPIPPKYRHKVEPFEIKHSEKERKKSQKAAELLAQRFKDMQRLAEEPEYIQAEVRQLQKQYDRWPMEDYIARAWRNLRHNRRETTTTTTLSGPMFSITVRRT